MRATWHGTTCSNLSPENQRGRQDRLTAGRGRTACEERGQGHSGPESAPALHPPEASQPGLHAPRPRPPTPELPGACQPPGNGNPKRQSPHAKLMTPPNFFLKRAALAFSVLPLPCRGNFRFLDGKVWPREWAPGFGSSLSHFPDFGFLICRINRMISAPWD